MTINNMCIVLFYTMMHFLDVHVTCYFTHEALIQRQDLSSWFFFGWFSKVS